MTIIMKIMIPVFNRFIDNTQTTCIITGIGLLIIVVIYWSGKYMFGSTIGKLIGLIVLIYAAYSCFSSTNTLIKNKEDIFKNPKFVVERTRVIKLWIWVTFSVALFVHS